MERPLFWRQGLFLQPQHFQLLERYNQALFTSFYKYQQPYPWGIGKIQIQDAALDNQTFNLLNGDFFRRQAFFPVINGWPWYGEVDGGHHSRSRASFGQVFPREKSQNRARRAGRITVVKVVGVRIIKIE